MRILEKYIFLIALGIMAFLISCGDKSRSGVEAGNAKIAGVIVDSEGKPVNTALVHLYVKSGDSLRLIAIDTTDALGQYSLETEIEGSLVLQIVVEQMVWVEQPVTVQTGTQTVNIDLPETPTGELVGDSGTFTDKRDGQLYPWVRIGAQTWMARNLNYSGDDGQGKRVFDRGWCYGVSPADTSVHTDSLSCEKYGRLYKWATAMDFTDSCDTAYCGNLRSLYHQGLCPAGWRLPDSLDFVRLDSFVVADQGEFRGSPFSSGYLKAAQTDSNATWNEAPYASADPYGFRVHPAGWADFTKLPAPYGFLGSIARYWTVEDYAEVGQTGGAEAWEFSSSVLVSTAGSKADWAFSVRCMAMDAHTELGN